MRYLNLTRIRVLEGKAASCSPSIVFLRKEDVGQFAVCVGLHGGIGLLVLVVVQIIQVQGFGALVLRGGYHHQARLERLQGAHTVIHLHILSVSTAFSWLVRTLALYSN